MSGNVSTTHVRTATRDPVQEEQVVLFLADQGKLRVGATKPRTEQRRWLRACLVAGWLKRKGARYVVTDRGEAAMKRVKP